MGPSVTRIRITGIALLVVVAVAIYLAVTAINGVPLYPYHTVSAQFTTASNLVPHDDVRVNGARIGQVSTITFNPQTQVSTVKMQIQPGHTVYADGQASIGDISALGAEYVNLTPGTKSSGSLANDMITTHATETPVEIDQILDIFGTAQADAAAASVQTLGNGFDGQQGAIHNILTSAPSLLPNISTTTQTLTDPATALIPLIQQSQQLASAFQGRNQQLAQLLGYMNTTFNALDTENGQALQDTINTAAPVLPQLTPALNDLAGAAGTTATAMTDLRPGLAALGSGTPNLREFLRDAVTPLDKTPGVANQAVPGVKGLSTTLQTMQVSDPVAPFLERLAVQADPLLSYLAPYYSYVTGFTDVFTKLLQDGDQFGNWLPFSVNVGNRTTDGGVPANDYGTGPLQVERCAYPAPGTANNLHTPEGCS